MTNQGAALHRKGDIESALDHYTKASNLSSQYPNATLLNNLGALYLQKGDIEKAKDYLTQAIKTSKGRYASPFINRALAKEKNKEFQSAYLDLKKAFILLDVLSPVNQADADREIMAEESQPPEPVIKPRPKSRPEIPEQGDPSFMSPPEKEILDQPEQVKKYRVASPVKASEIQTPEWAIQLYAVKHKIALEKLRKKLNGQGIEYFIRKKGRFHMIFLKPGYHTKNQAISALIELKQSHDPRLTMDAYINSTM